MFYGTSLQEAATTPETVTAEQFAQALYTLEEASYFLETSFDEDEYLSEGANTEINKKYNKMKAELNDYVTKIKKALKKHDRETAWEYFDKSKAVLNEMRAEVKAMDSDMGSAAWGFVAGTLMQIGRNFASILCFGVSYKLLADFAISQAISLPVGLFVTTMVEAISTASKVAEGVKEGDSTPNMLNKYRTELLKSIDIMEHNLDSIKKQIKSQRDFDHNMEAWKNWLSEKFGKGKKKDKK